MAANIVRHKKILALDWDLQTLRLVHAHIGKRGVKIDRILSVAIPPELDVQDPQQMGSHIRRALDQEAISTKHGVVDIPRDQAILKMLSLPNAREEDLPGIVQIQIAKELPYTASDALIDFAVSAEPGEEGVRDVLVAAVRREVLHYYEATFEAAGLKLDRAGLRPYANKIAVCEQLKVAMPERVVFIDLRPTLTEIDILRNTSLAFSRAASVHIPKENLDAPKAVGGLRLTPSFGDTEAGGEAGASMGLVESRGEFSGVIQSLLVEVTRSIEAYRVNDAGAQIDHAVIAGDLGVEEALAEAMQKRLGIPTELYNPASSFGWTPEEGAAASAFSASLGLILGHTSGGALQFDFLHPKKIISRAQERLKLAPRVAAIAALFLIAITVLFIQNTSPARAKLKDLDRQIAELEAKKAEGKKLLDVMQLAKDFDQGQIVWVDVLMDAVSCLPGTEDLVITQMDMQQKDGRITLKTKTRTRDAVTQVEQRLREFRREGKTIPRFEVNVGAQTEKKGEKYPFWQDFRIAIKKDDPPKKSGKGSGDSPTQR